MNIKISCEDQFYSTYIVKQIHNRPHRQQAVQKNDLFEKIVTKFDIDEFFGLFIFRIESFIGLKTSTIYFNLYISR